MRKRENFVLGQVALLVSGCCLIVPGVVGCGSSANGAGSEYQEYSQTEVRKPAGTDLPKINPGEPGHDLDKDESDVTNSEPTAGSLVQAGSEGGPTQPSNSGPKVVPAALETATEDTRPAQSVEPAEVVPNAEPAAEGTPVLTESGTRSEVVIAAREPKLLIAEHSFQRDRETKALRVTYDDIDLLRILNMEPVPVDAVEHFPKWLKSLNGKRIRIRGFMYPPYKATGLTKFGLARDNGICCFVRQAKIYDLFAVQMAEGSATDYIQNRPFDVVGTFHIDPVVDEGELFRLYRIDNARVIEK